MTNAIPKSITDLDEVVSDSTTKRGATTSKLATTPKQHNAITGNVSIVPFTTGSAEQFVQFLAKLDQVVKSLDVTNAHAMYKLARTMLQGEALQCFNAKTIEIGAETVSHYHEVLQALTYMFPANKSIIQKRTVEYVVQMKSQCCSVRQFKEQLNKRSNMSAQGKRRAVDDLNMPGTAKRQKQCDDNNNMPSTAVRQKQRYNDKPHMVKRQEQWRDTPNNNDGTVYDNKPLRTRELDEFNVLSTKRAFCETDETLNVVSMKHVRRHRDNKRTKLAHTRPMTFGVLRCNQTSTEGKTVKVLIDSGATKSFVNKAYTANVKKTQVKTVTFKTGNGEMSTNLQTRMHLILPEFYTTRVVEHTYHILNEDFGYDVIIGLDLLKSLGLQIDFGAETITWDEAEIPFKEHDATPGELFPIHDPIRVQAGMDRITELLEKT